MIETLPDRLGTPATKRLEAQMPRYCVYITSPGGPFHAHLDEESELYAVLVAGYNMGWQRWPIENATLTTRQLSGLSEETAGEPVSTPEAAADTSTAPLFNEASHFDSWMTVHFANTPLDAGDRERMWDAFRAGSWARWAATEQTP